MKILWLHERMGAMGGAESNVLASAQALKARGHTNILAHLSETGRGTEMWREAFEAMEPVRNDLSAILAFHRPDVVWIHNWPSTEEILHLARGPVPSARMIHDHAMYCLRTYKYHPLTRRNCTRPASGACVFPCLAILRRGADRRPVVDFGGLSRKLAEIAANRALSRVVVASRFMRGELEGNHFDPERIVVIPPVPPEAASATAIDTRPEAGRLLFVGQMIRGKGLDVLLEAVAGLHGTWRLDAAGEGVAKSKLRAQAARLGLNDRVEFFGHLRPHELEALYRRAQVVVFPSMWPEPFGLVGIEAMRVGRPVVAFDVGGVSDWLVNGENGLLVPWGDRAALTAALRRLIDDPAEAARLGARGRILCAERFSFAGYIDSLETFLNGLAAVSPHGR